MTKEERNLRDGNQELLARGLAGSGVDYDYSKIKKTDKQDERGHSTDSGKLPWHPTFSDQSEYSSSLDRGGHWGKTVDGKDTYTPSQTMIDRGNTAGLAQYMKDAEPNVRLIMPKK